MTEEQQGVLVSRSDGEHQRFYTSVSGKRFPTLRELHSALHNEYLEYLLGRQIEDVETAYL